MNKLILLVLLPLASAQQLYTISTVAGVGVQTFSGSGGPALDAQLIQPQYIACDSAGNVFVNDVYYQQIFRISADGTITLYAGNGIPGFSGDGGPAPSAQLNNPLGITADAAGDLFIMDNGNQRIRKVTPDGIISTVANVAGATVALDAAGNFYVSQIFANIVHKVSPSGVVTTFAGTGQPGAAGDGGMATAAQLFSPGGIRVDSAGNVYVVDSGNNKIRKISPDGVISTFAGNGKAAYAGDGGPAVNASLLNPSDIAIGADGRVYLADSGELRIRVVTPDGIISTFAGGVSGGATGTSLDDGPASQALLAVPVALAFDHAGSLEIALGVGHQVRKVTGAQISTVAGIPPTVEPSDNGPATSALLLSPDGLAIDDNGAIYLSDGTANRIRKVTPDGIITTFAGDGLLGVSPDRSPPAVLGAPRSLTFDQAGNLYVIQVNAVLEIAIASDGLLRTIAGSFFGGFSGDNGPAAAALLTPGSVAVDAQGNIYVADTNNNRIRRIDAASKIITTIAGTGVAAYGGDSGPATAAMLYHPNQLALDGNGNLYVADTGNVRIRKISPDGTITTVAGDGTLTMTDDGAGDGGDASAAVLYQPTALAIDAAGNLYIASVFGTRIRMVDSATNIISTIAGSQTLGFSGDGGLATSALLGAPTALTVDSSGDIYFVDTKSFRVRKLTPAQP